ncbi:MAG TPA: HAD-IA family hydrolase [Vicinamibacterales bacterium]
MSGPRLIVFDLDGTLIDSRRDLADAANALIAEHGGAPLPVDGIAGMVGEGAALLVRRALSAAGVRLDVARDLPRFLELYDQRLLAHTTLYDGAREMLEALEQKSALAVLTNKPQRHTDAILVGLGIASAFRWIVGGDSAHGRKPDPAGLRYEMTSAAAVPSDTLMVGDSAIDLKTARAAGVRICLVRYGFGFRSTEGMLQGDELIADSPSAIVRLAA